MDKEIYQKLLEIQSQVAIAQKGINIIAAHQGVILELLILAQKDADSIDTKAVLKALQSDISQLAAQLDHTPSLETVFSTIGKLLEDGKRGS